jgi:hypothetical protein
LHSLTGKVNQAVFENPDPHQDLLQFFPQEIV